MSRHTTFAALVVVALAFLTFGCGDVEDTDTQTDLTVDEASLKPEADHPSFGVNPEKPYDFGEGEDNDPSMGANPEKPYDFDGDPSMDDNSKYTKPEVVHPSFGENPEKPYEFGDGEDNDPSMGENPEKPQDAGEGENDDPSMGPNSKYTKPERVLPSTGENPGKPYDFGEGDDNDPSMGTDGAASTGIAAEFPMGANEKKPGEDPFNDEPSMGQDGEFADDPDDQGREDDQFSDGDQLPKWLVIYLLENREEGENPGAGPDEQ